MRMRGNKLKIIVSKCFLRIQKKVKVGIEKNSPKKELFHCIYRDVWNWSSSSIQPCGIQIMIYCAYKINSLQIEMRKLHYHSYYGFFKHSADDYEFVMNIYIYAVSSFPSYDGNLVCSGPPFRHMHMT